MKIAVPDFFFRTISLNWLTGPIFDKELRVSSRKRRNYVLRFVYLALLTVFVAMVWASVLSVYAHTGPAYQSSTAYAAAQISLAGTTIISSIINFQFWVTQLLAIVMLSTAISDEIYNRTLGILMTTPINSFQIVMGKLFSRLLQLILLMAITLPLLAIIRVFGGVPWGFVISGLCITLTAIIFAGSLSLYFSIHSRRAYVVILRTVFTLALLYGFIPAMTIAIANSYYHVSPPELIPYLALANPVFYIKFHTIMMLSPGGIPMLLLPWPVHCAIMLAASAVVLAWTIKVVRKVALRQAVGQIDNQAKPKRRKNKKKLSLKATTTREYFGPIRRVNGSPIIWKELRAPIIQGGEGRNSLIGLVVAIIALLITYAVCAKQRCLDVDTIHVMYALIFVLMGLIINMVISATTITSEKEARSWPILLTTPLADWHILLGKAFGVFRRCLPIWSLLAGHVAVFVLVGYIHPITVLHLTMIVTWIIVFLCGSGLYFSTRFKRTTSAVVANVALALTLWAVIPIILGLVSVAMEDEDIINAYASVNPVVQAAVVVHGAAGPSKAKDNVSMLRYDWPDEHLNANTTTLLISVTMLIYMSAGCLFAWRAKHRLRRNIF